MQADFAPAKEGLPETAAFEEVQVLLAQQAMGSQLPQDVPHRIEESMVGHLKEIGFSEVLEFVTGSVGHELREIDRLIDLGQFVVVKVARDVLPNPVQFHRHQAPVFVGGVLGLGEELNQRRCLLNAFFRRLQVSDVKEQHFAHHGPQVAPGQSIVAYKGDSLRR